MKIKYLPILFVLLGFQYSNAQIGMMNNNPNASAALDLDATNKGFLAPRVALSSTTDVATILAPANSLLVYNTASVSDVTPGYYYWSTSKAKWVKFLDEAVEPWQVSGSTTLATANDQSIYQMGKIGIGTNSPGYALEIVNDGLDNSFDDLGLTSISNTGNRPLLRVSASRGSKATPINLQSADYMGGLAFGGFYNNAWNIGVSAINSRYLGDGTTALSDLLFTTSNATRMRIDQNGNVAISSNPPTERLDIAGGNVRIQDINTTTGLAADKVVVADATGVLKTISRADVTTKGNLTGTGVVSVTTGANAVLSNANVTVTPGNQGDVLTTSTTGTVAWQPAVARVRVVDGVRYSGPGLNFNTAGTVGGYLQSYIDLPVGRWIVNIGVLVAPLVGQALVPNSNYVGRFTLSSSMTVPEQTNFSFVGGRSLVIGTFSTGPNPPRYAGFASGTVYVNVTTAGRLYLWDRQSFGGPAGGSFVGGSESRGAIWGNSENYIYAIEAN